jgi:hypothetical protein
LILEYKVIGAVVQSANPQGNLALHDDVAKKGAEDGFVSPKVSVNIMRNVRCES